MYLLSSILEVHLSSTEVIWRTIDTNYIDLIKGWVEDKNRGWTHGEALYFPQQNTSIPFKPLIFI